MLNYNYLNTESTEQDVLKRKVISKQFYYKTDGIIIYSILFFFVNNIQYTLTSINNY